MIKDMGHLFESGWSSFLLCHLRHPLARPDLAPAELFL